jgi:hypothetical protein
MIQRIQSLYLLLVILFSSVLVYLFLQPENESILSSIYWLDLIFYTIPLLSFVCVFLYGKRKVQAVVCLVLILFNLIPVIIYGQKVYNGSFDMILYIVIGISLLESILLLLARRAILKDEKLVRSIDRIR